MSIWSRFKRAIKSLFGGAVSAMEDPRLILEENIRELNDQVPEMNENIATVKAQVIKLEKEVKRSENEVADLKAKIQSAIENDRDDIAQKYALRYEKEQESLEKTKGQLQHAQQAYEKALKVKEAFMREKEKKIEEAQEALRAHERAQWQSEIADTMEQFEVSGLDQTHDEMIDRLQDETARNEARMEIAMDSVDTEEMQIEQDAEEIRAAQIVDEFKKDMGKETSSDAEQIDLPDEEEKERDEPSKTIGRQRTQEE